ncbi:MAG: peptidylprolyl isomerase [Actinomycetota bacterium]
MSQNSPAGKGAKRQRKKEGRRARIEQEIRAHQARRRRRLAINLGVLLALGALVFFLISRSEEPAEKTSADPCKHSKPAAGNTETGDKPPAMSIDPAKTYTAVIQTSCGTVEAELAASSSPNTVNSFVALARQGFFNGLSFHRIVKDFAIQGGDPKGDGTGGPGYKTVDPPPADVKYLRGVIAMAKGGNEAPGTAGSQFFIVPSDDAATRLTPDYALLGKVTKGLPVVARLNDVETEASAAGGEVSRPVKPVFIVKVSVREGAAASPPPPG